MITRSHTVLQFSDYRDDETHTHTHTHTHTNKNMQRVTHWNETANSNRMWATSRSFLWQRAVGQVNCRSVSSQPYRIKNRTQSKEKNREAEIPRWQIEKETTKETKSERKGLNKETRGEWKGRGFHRASRQPLARCHLACRGFSTSDPLVATNSRSDLMAPASLWSFEMKAYKLVAFIRATSCLYFQLNQA